MPETLLDVVLDPFVMLRAVRNQDGRIVDFVYEYANVPACTYHRTTNKLLVGQRLLERQPDQAEGGLFRRFAGVVETGLPLVSRTLCFNESLAGSEVAARPELRASKVGDGVTCTWRDANDGQRTELRAELQSRLLDEVDAAIIATDAQFRIEYWSKGAARLYGWDRDEVLGKSSEEVLKTWQPEKDIRLAVPEMSSEAVEAEFDLVRKDGSRVNVLVRTVPLWDEDLLTGVLGVAVDITERKAAERELNEARDFLETISNNMSEGLLAFDHSGRLTYLNAAAGRLLGWPVEELTGKLMHETIHSEHLDGTFSPPDQCPLLMTRTAGETIHTERDVFVRRNGTRLPVSYSSSPLRSGSAGGAVIVFADITARIGEQLRMEQALDKLAWVGRIQDALEQDRFVLYAQPIVDLRTRAVVQHELLIRLKAPDGTLVLPAAFLAAAEEYGLIDRIDRWVVKESARLALAGHAVEFNLSARSVGSVEILRTLQDALATGAPPDNLVCEITETAIMQDNAAGESFVRAVRELGCKVALDDFGTGFGGLAYLKSLPLSYLKIDIQFVRDLVREPTSQHVVRAIVSLARGFGLATIAEGAEDGETVELLKALEVDFAQGYFFGLPGPLDEVFPAAAQVTT